jgi:hypothetical protein
VSWREDQTNHEGRFLRSKLRKEAMPALEQLFPRMVERLVEQALQAQRGTPGNSQQPEFGVNYLFRAASLDLRRNHLTFLKELEKRVNEGDSRSGEWSLPDGWKLRWEGASKSRKQRWILERN